MNDDTDADDDDLLLQKLKNKTAQTLMFPQVVLMIVAEHQSLALMVH